METTEKEKAIIEQIIRKKENNEYKWAYLLFPIVEEKMALKIPFSDIAKWLSANGLQMKENTLKNAVWRYKKGLKTENNKISEL